MSTQVLIEGLFILLAIIFSGLAGFSVPSTPPRFNLLALGVMFLAIFWLLITFWK